MLTLFPTTPTHSEYTLDATGEACFRTTVAAAISYMQPAQWLAFIQGHGDDGFDQTKNNGVVAAWVRVLAAEVEAGLNGIEKLLEKKAFGDAPRDLAKVDVARRRWRQIGGICAEALKGLAG